MARLRFHLLSILAVLLAVGVGLVWGAGPLAEQAHSTVRTEIRESEVAQRQLTARVADLERRLRVGDQVVSSVARATTARRLHERTVAVVVLPGADARVVARTTKGVKAAGAEVTATITLTRDYIDPAKAVSPLEDLALRLVPPGVTFRKGASAIDRVSTILARAVVTARADEAGKLDDAGAAVLAGLAEIDALKVTGEVGTRAELAVVVAGRPLAGTPSTREANAGTADTLWRLAQALDVASRGAVVVGAEAAARPGGVIAAVRKGERGVSTVDLGGSAAGPLATVLALAEQLRGESGHYGVGRRAERVIPRVEPSTR